MVKTISISDEAYNLLKSIKRKDESFSDMTLPALKCGVSRPNGRATPNGGRATPTTWSPEGDHDTFHYRFNKFRI